MRSAHPARLAVLACFSLMVFGAALVSPCAAQTDLDSPKFVTFAGAGMFLTHERALGEVQAGASFELSAPNRWIGFGLEGGHVGPWSRPKAGSAILSLNYTPSWKLDEKGHLLSFATVGYTRLFGTGNAVNFGGGLDLRLNDAHAIRLEARDYYSPSSSPSSQHNVAFRIGWVIYLAD